MGHPSYCSDTSGYRGNIAISDDSQFVAVSSAKVRVETWMGCMHVAYDFCLPVKGCRLRVDQASLPLQTLYS